MNTFVLSLEIIHPIYFLKLWRELKFNLSIKLNYDKYNYSL